VSRVLRRSDAEILAAFAEHGTAKHAARALGMRRSTYHYRLSKLRSVMKLQPLIRGRVDEPQEQSRPFGGFVRRYIITSAQNNTPVHSGVWQTLLRIAEDMQAEIIVSRYTYYKGMYIQAEVVKGGDDDTYCGLWYDQEIAQFVCDEKVNLAPGLVFCGELNIQPTESNPLSGFSSYTGQRSCVIPHSTFAMQSVAGGPQEQAKLLYTTGTVTQRNYIPRKSGHKAEFHHGYGAVLVEVDVDGCWWVRQLNADRDGAIHDLGVRYTPDGGKDFVGVEALNFGDLHAVWQTEQSLAPLLDMIAALRPRYVFAHDTLDWRVRNHHTLKDPLATYVNYTQGHRRVEDELRLTCALIDRMRTAAGDGQVVVVDSNHDGAFVRWLKESDHRRDPGNAIIFLEASLAMWRHVAEHRDARGFSALGWAHQRYGQQSGTTPRFLREGESFVVCHDAGGGIECGMHGHLGINGSRGSPAQFSRMGRKANTGHTHSAGIIQGVYTAGVSGPLDHGYNVGPSSWSNSHIVTHANGKRQIITERGGRWTAGQSIGARACAA
jgi:hypothetical protein